jgi:adenosylcobinamide-GDP ribazoletransferase
MRNLMTAISMVWGNFTVLPCPYKRWDSKLNNLMLALLPAVGAVLGGLWALLIWILHCTGMPVQLQALAATFYIYAVCGFMHMDGFMDCNDAILSRRPLEERQRILKDSTVGAFAVVTVLFLVLAFYVSMEVILAGPLSMARLASLCLIPVVSRAMAGSGVLEYKPIGHSQYKASYDGKGKGSCKAAVLIELVVCIAVAVAVALGGRPYVDTFFSALVVAVAASIAMLCARRQLGGMSGDIAGYAICWSEMAGVVYLAVAAGC